jgi:hypothetical protein
MVTFPSENQPLRTSRSIQEFRIDFFLEEEFSVDPSFAKAFMDACKSNLTFTGVEHVVHSSTDKFGEADLIVIVTAKQPSGELVRLAILIEDKITAGFQPSQADRYRQRGVDGVTNGRWNCFKTVLVAPSAYITPEHGFNAAVSLEQIKEWICLGDAARRSFKIAKIDEAVSKKNATGVQIVDPDMTSFRAAYYNYLQAFNTRRGTDFTMRPPGPTYYGDVWFILKSAGLPNWSEIRHMPQTGSVEVSFKDTDFSKVAALGALLDKDMILMPTGKYKQHVTIRLPAPKISVFDDFVRDQTKVETALRDAERLWRLVQQKRLELDAILIPARHL